MEERVGSAHDGAVRIRLDPSSPVPLSAQLRDRIAASILTGRLHPGERLPPVRRLAADLRLAANTVARAYRELEDAGLLVGRGRHGTFVTERLPEPPPRADTELASAADTFARRARQLGATPADALEAVHRAFRDRA